MPVRLMIVDDSNFMRKAIALILSKTPEIEVVSLIGSGEEALQKIADVKPDVVSLDVNLSGMDGIETLDRIMETCPTPVIMFSGQTKEGAEVTLRALEKGAIDFVAKPHGCLSPDLSSVRDELIEKVLAASRTRISRRMKTAATRAKAAAARKKELKQIANPEKSILFIASSTGGVQALNRLIPDLPGNLPMPVIIVQHMPKTFTKSLAESLDKISAITVMEAEDGHVLEQGNVYVAPGGWHTTVVKSGAARRIKLVDTPKMKLMPCADVTMESLPKVYGPNVLAMILTGMGDDGTKGAAFVKKEGGTIIAQDEATSLIYGMPKAVAARGLVDHIWPLDQMGRNLIAMLENDRSGSNKISMVSQGSEQSG